MASSSATGPRGFLLHLGLRRLPGVEDTFLEIAPIHQFLKLSPKSTSVHSTMAHTIVESTILPGSWSLRVGQEWSQVPDDLPALDSVVHLVHGNFEWSEVSFIPVDLDQVLSRLVDSSDCLTRSLLQRTRMCLMFLHVAPSLGGGVGRTSDSILNLDVLLNTGENVPHLGDLVFH